MSTGTILLIIVLVLLIGGSPMAGWGYGPSGLLGLVLVVVLVLMLTGRL